MITGHTADICLRTYWSHCMCIFTWFGQHIFIRNENTQTTRTLRIDTKNTPYILVNRTKIQSKLAADTNYIRTAANRGQSLLFFLRAPHMPHNRWLTTKCTHIRSHTAWPLLGIVKMAAFMACEHEKNASGWAFILYYVCYVRVRTPTVPTLHISRLIKCFNKDARNSS